MKREPTWVQPFFDAYRATGNIRASAQAVGIHHDTPGQYAIRHLQFRERWHAIRRDVYTRFYYRRSKAIYALAVRSLPVPSRTFVNAFEAIDAAEQAGALTWEEAIVLRARYRVKVMV